MILGESLEDYLECLLILEEKGKIRSVDVAGMLHVSKPSVNQAMKALKEKGYIEQEAYKEPHLTEIGRTYAKKILHRHHSLRSFLTDILHVSDATAEEDACKIEHILSEETFDKLCEFQKLHK